MPAASCLNELFLRPINNRSANISSLSCSQCVSPSSSSGTTSPVPQLINHHFNGGKLNGEIFRISSDCRDSPERCSKCLISNVAQNDESSSLLVSIIGWYPCLLFRMFRTLLYVACSQTIMAIPIIWLWLIWKLILIPVHIGHLILRIISRRYFRIKNALVYEDTIKKPIPKTVMISNGSTIQSLHLARNFYKAGARVVVFEFEGYFPLTKYSNSIAHFYTLPKSCRDNFEEYTTHLKDIVIKECVTYYVPICIQNPVKMDALAKASLESLNCTCFCPDDKDIALMDDSYTMLKFCEQINKPVPDYRIVYNKSDLVDFYMESDGHLPMETSGCYLIYTPKNQKIQLPLTLSELNDNFEDYVLNSRSLLIHEPLDYKYYFTCTTVKNTKVIANVTCQMESKNLVPVKDTEIDEWLNTYFNYLSDYNQCLNGHMTFKFCKQNSNPKTLLPLSCKFNISLPYICYESNHAKIILTPVCRHKTIRDSVENNGRYWIHKEVLGTLKNPSIWSVNKLIGTVLDQREALFSIRDPLPYYAYYQLKVLKFIQQRRQNVPRAFHSFLLK